MQTYRVYNRRFFSTVEYDYPKFHLTMHCYLCSLLTEALHLNEHEAARWLSMDNLDSVEWLPADLEVVESIKNQIRLWDIELKKKRRARFHCLALLESDFYLFFYLLIRNFSLREKILSFKNKEKQVFLLYFTHLFVTLPRLTISFCINV